jgi:hypothetical protein
VARKSRNKPWVDQAKSNDQNNVNNLIDFSGRKEQKNLDNFNQNDAIANRLNAAVNPQQPPQNNNPNM